MAESSMPPTVFFDKTKSASALIMRAYSYSDGKRGTAAVLIVWKAHIWIIVTIRIPSSLV